MCMIETCGSFNCTMKFVLAQEMFFFIKISVHYSRLFDHETAVNNLPSLVQNNNSTITHDNNVK